MSKLTPWFNRRQKPVRVGFYERLDINKQIYRDLWDGGAWWVSYHNVQMPSDLPWRGLAEKPKD